jgi:hypothetical protein
MSKEQGDTHSPTRSSSQSSKDTVPTTSDDDSSGYRSSSSGSSSDGTTSKSGSDSGKSSHRSSSSSSVPVNELFRSRKLIADIRKAQGRAGHASSSGSSSPWPSSEDDSKQSDGDWRKKFEDMTAGDDRVTRGIEEGVVVETPTLNFDMMEPVIYGLNEKQRADGKVPYEIYVFEDMKDVIRTAALMESGHLSQDSIGILYRPGAHTTPIFLTRNGREVIAINTDSVLFYVDDGEMLKCDLQELSQHMAVYSLGITAGEESELRRQYDNYSCAVFAMHDLIHMLETDFVACEGKPLVDFVLAESRVVPSGAGGGKLYDLRALPSVFMAITQSIHGKKEAGVEVRRGLEHHLEARPESASRSTPTPSPAQGMEGAHATLQALLDYINNSGKRNDYAKNFNKRLYDIYVEHFGCQEKRDFSVLKAQVRSPKPASRLVYDGERWPTYAELSPAGVVSCMLRGADTLCISPILVEEEDVKVEDEVRSSITPPPSSPLPRGVVNSALLRTPDRGTSNSAAVAGVSPSSTIVKPHAYRTPPRRGAVSTDAITVASEREAVSPSVYKTPPRNRLFTEEEYTSPTRGDGSFTLPGEGSPWRRVGTGSGGVTR